MHVSARELSCMRKRNIHNKIGKGKTKRKKKKKKEKEKEKGKGKRKRKKTTQKSQIPSYRIRIYCFSIL